MKNWLILLFLFIILLDGSAGVYFLLKENIPVISNPIPAPIVKKAKEYTSTKLKIALNLFIATLIYFAVLFFFSHENPYQEFSTYKFITTAFIMVAGLFVLTLSFRFLSYKTEVKYGLSLLSTQDWFIDRVKEFFVLQLATLLFFLLLGTFRDKPLILTASLLIFLFSLNVITPFLINVFVKGERVEGDRVSYLLEKMGEEHHVKIKGYYILKEGERSKKVNAMVAGIGPTLRVMIYDNLLKDFSPDEVLSVVAHEFYHWKSKHIIKGFLLSSFIFLSFLFFLYKLYPPLLWGVSHVKTLSFIMAFAILFNVSLMPFTNTVSRIMERNADRFSVKIAGKEPFISTEIKLVEKNLIDPSPPPLLEFFLYNHPSAIKRINMALEKGK